MTSPAFFRWKPALWKTALWPALSFFVLPLALPLAGANAQAPRTPVLSAAPLAPATPAAPVVTAPAINILVLALDDLTTPLWTPPVPVVGGAGITPARFRTLQPVWQALAEKKKDKDDDLFRLEPDPRGALPAGQTAPLPTQNPAPAGVEPLPAPQPVAPTPFIAPAPQVGRSQLTAVHLRRTLLALGYGDVQTTAPDGSVITRVVNEKRLTMRVVENLRASFAPIAQSTGPIAPANMQNAVLAAARLGGATGYRAVAVLWVSPPANKDAGQNAAFSLLLVDAPRETGEPIIFDAAGADEAALRDAGASTGAALVDKNLRGWPIPSPADNINNAQKHFGAARAAIEAGDNATAQDELNQVISLDPRRGDAYVSLGDVLQETDPAGAAQAYRRAVELNTRDGVTWAKIAVAYTTGAIPDWPRALDAGRKALDTGYDSVSLRVALATAQFGRAELFRKAERFEKAEDSEFDARRHLDRALELAPDNPSAVRLLAGQLVAQNRFDEAVQILDRVAPTYPKDIEIQTQYAKALAGTTGREEDVFVTWSRVWKLTNQTTADLDATSFRRFSEGYDVRVFGLGKSASQLTTGVANGALPREAALLQMTKLREDMESASDALSIPRATTGGNPEALASRVFAADLMSQSLENHQTYLETGQDIYRVRGLELYRQAVARLNVARGGK